jgi:SprA family protein
MEIQPSNNPAHLPFPQNIGIDQSARNKETEQHADSTNSTESTKSEPTQSESTNTQQKNPEEQRLINELRAKDQEVRAHELAHAAAAGGLAKGGPTFEYQRGPDGQLYAVGGEVQIDTSGIPGDPEATLQKAQQIQQAALAPAQPSAQDRSVAIAAAAMAAEARAEIASQNASDGSNGGDAEENTQRIATKVNEAYNNGANTDTDQSKTLINLTA